MSNVSCPRCGAQLDLSRRTDEGVRCAYCQTFVPATQRLPAELVAAQHLDASLSAKLDQHAARSRGLLLAVGGGIAALVGAVLVLLTHRTNGTANDAPVAQHAARPVASAPPPSPTPPPASPPPTPAAPPLPAPRVAFGGEGTGEGRFTGVKAIAVDRAGTVYIADRTGRIQAFDSAGTLQRTLRVSTTRVASGPLDQDITEVEGLAATANGKLWVSIGYDLVRIDAVTGRVEHSTRGASGRTCFRDVSVSPLGQLHARSACTATNRYALVHLDAGGRELHRYADPPDYDRACSGRVAVDGAGRWFVPYASLEEVRILEPNGSVHTRIVRGSDTPDAFRSHGVDAVALDVAGHLYVRDSGVLRIFDGGGRHLRDFDPGALGGMRSFALGADGTIWVITGAGRVGAFAPLSF